jgi:Raf kinase inhibitor-like YbhB/YbcL family protein
VLLVLALLLTSSTFKDGHTVPLSMVAAQCGGANATPQLAWSRAPAGTRSFALIVHDVDAPASGGFYHWVAYNIPSSQRMLAAGSTFGPGRDGKNDTGTLGYFGPCPPPGLEHHYRFTVYALSVPAIESDAPLTARELLDRMRGHILDQATYTGTWSVQR